MKTALLFSGQGSQYVGMMKDIAEHLPSAIEFLNKADKILDYSLSNICFNGPIDTLKETRYTQPALFVHEALIMYLLKDKIKFDAVSGHSVGEYAALYSAGVLDFENALKLVSLRGELMFHAGENEPGTMFAVINLEDDKVVEVCKKLTEEGNGNVVVAANYNSPGQIVVSGSAQYLQDNISAFKQAGAKLVKELVVSGAFHSPLMLSAKKELESAINDVSFNDAKAPVYVNASAKAMMKADDLKDALIMQLTSPVLWTQSMLAMKNAGIVQFIEIGPGTVLQGLVKRTLQDIDISGIDKIEDILNFK
jgi:[acyl-carrier-protein] S-malonyltransferase